MKSFFKYIKEEVSLFGKLFFGIIFIFLLLSAVIMPAVAVYMLSTAIIAFSFYCCVTWFCIKNSENKTDGAAKAVVKAIKKSDFIYLMGHKRADFDSFGACAGLYEICKKYKKNAKIIIGDDIFAIKDIYDKYIQNDEYKDIFISSADAESGMGKNSLVILCDTHALSLVENISVFKKAKYTIIIDHHKDSGNAVFADYMFIEPKYSSSCEIVTDILKGSGVSPSVVVSESLLAGLIVDTRSFSINSTEGVFYAAAYLCEKGADTVSARKLFKNNMKLEMAKANAVESSKIYKSGIIFSVCDYNHKNVYLACARAADELLDIKGVEASIVICKYNTTVFVSARSNGRVDVGKILKKLGGGGHLNMAGVQFEGKSIADVEKMLKKSVDEYLLEVNENESNSSCRC